MASTSAATTATTASARPKKKYRKPSQFRGRDRTVFLLMVGIPTFLHVMLVWVPTISSVFLSFTDWNGIRFADMNWVGFLNYEQILTVFEKDFWQAVINNAVLLVFLFIGPTIFGMFLAYLLDKNIRGSRFYQSVFYTPVVLSLAVVGFMWQSVIYSTDNGLATQLFGGGESVDWLGNQSFLIPFGDTYGVSKNFVAILVAIAWRHTGYIMVLYLAGLKSVDTSLKEAASIDGCTEWQSFRHVVFPTLKPINVVVAVITVIEALRAFDIIFVLNTPRKTEVLSILTTNNLLGEGGGNVGRGSAYATILFLMCLGFVIWYVTNHYRNTQEGAGVLMAATTTVSDTEQLLEAEFERNKQPLRASRVVLYIFLTITALVWIIPIFGALYASFRPFSETVREGAFSWPNEFTLDNYRDAWEQGDILRKYWNTALILVPALALTLFFSSMVAFAASRYSWKFNITFLVLFTAGNLLPQQIIIQPLFQIYNRIPLPDFMSNSGKLNGSTWGLILIHVAFQSGFCTFVLSNYMKLLPRSLNEAARVDGAGVWTLYWRVIMPLTRPALAALATLEFTWIYNDFFWAVVLEQQGADRPITSSLANLGGEFATDDNLIAAASMYVAIPTLLVYLALQRHFIAGLTLGADKG